MHITETKQNRLWRLILDGPGDGAVNMAVDRALLRACETGAVPPTLRVYGWIRPTVSVGYSQNLERDLDGARCREWNIPVVRRPTGGRALLHDREVTYALVAPAAHPVFGAGLKDAFDTISRLLIAGLVEWGLPRELLQTPNGGRARREAHRSPACFAALNHGEIAVGGKKLIGSAQRRTHRAFLQHGSLLLEPDAGRITQCCRYADEAARRRDEDRLRRGSVALSEIGRHRVVFDEVARALVRGFQQGLPGDWQAGDLTAAERELRDAFLTGS